MKFNIIITIVFISFISIFAQKSVVKLSIDGQPYLFPSMNKHGIDYISLKSFSEELSVPHLYNPDVKKMEIRFSDYIIKFTARNQFVVITSMTDSRQEIYQMQVPALLSMEDILVPVQYSIELLLKAYGKEIKIIESSLENETPGTGTEIVEKPGGEEKTNTAGLVETKGFDVTGVSLDVKTNGTLIRVKSQKKIGKFSQSIIDGILFLNIIGSNLDTNNINSVQPAGLVKNIIAKNILKNSQIEFELEDNYDASEAIRLNNSNDLLITIHNKIFAKPTTDKNKERWKFDAVVIDAGHGGKDPGAIGINGVEEKKINLSIALKLGKLIEKNLPGVKVYYTRTTDKFVELYKRGKIANEKNGNLFISVHCNSTKQKPTNLSGFEVYLLRPGRTREAIEIAEMENSVINYEDNPKRYQELTDENFILVTMAHSSFMKYSEKFSEILSKEFADENNIKSGGVKQAGFYVLVGASMPSVLVECGYLSNKKDAAYLTGKRGQEETAETIFKAVKKFKDEYDSEIKYTK
jgi:N-acetylmuramoyl-L-alanine amidase